MSESQSLKKLNVGCGKNILPGFVNLDKTAGDGVDVVFDLETCLQRKPFMMVDVDGMSAKESTTEKFSMQLPFADDTFDRIVCSHTMEHIHNFLPVMEELWRVAKPNARAVFITPYGGCDIAFEDPTHVRQFFGKSWLYASQVAYNAADYSYRGDWDCARLIFTCAPNIFPPDTEPQEMMGAITQLRNVCLELTAELVAIKPARLPGTGTWDPTVEIRRRAS